MARVKRGTMAHKRKKRILDDAEGYRDKRHRLLKVARESVHRGWQYATRDRKQRKRNFRALWIARINAAARDHGLSYSRMIHGLAAAGVEVDRKSLAELALSDAKAFAQLAELAKAQAGRTA
jgi:large subunit ribosomal protein L20